MRRIGAPSLVPKKLHPKRRQESRNRGCWYTVEEFKGGSAVWNGRDLMKSGIPKIPG